MKEVRHHIRYVGRAHAIPVRHIMTTDASSPPQVSLARMLASFGDGLDEESLDAWSEALQPRGHRPS